eukprot:m.72180 g.72180  ORF g.72180 m.72180 type:complete len:164 (+) comp13849_c3_seq4:3566-4057(+)
MDKSHTDGIAIENTNHALGLCVHVDGAKINIVISIITNSILEESIVAEDRYRQGNFACIGRYDERRLNDKISRIGQKANFQVGRLIRLQNLGLKPSDLTKRWERRREGKTENKAKYLNEQQHARFPRSASVAYHKLNKRPSEILELKSYGSAMCKKHIHRLKP